MKSVVKKLLIAVGAVLCAVVLLLGGLILYLSVTEFNPDAVEPAHLCYADPSAPAADNTLTLYSWNIGYAGLGKDSDFFMDGGQMVNPPSQKAVEENLAGINAFIRSHPGDVWMLQEVDLCSARTGYTDQLQSLGQSVPGSYAFAHNYLCPFVPIPLPPMGRMESGIATLTGYAMQDDAQRIALPCPFSWPVRIANLKRCLLVTRMDIQGSDKQLVLVNLHLEAYDDGAGKIAQTELLMELLKEEAEKGNYVIAGGDFNQSFPDALKKYPITDPAKWTPGILSAQDLPEGFQFAYDSAAPTCRLLDQPYSEACQLYVIDGFILSENVQLESVQTISCDFEFSDHNPVCLKVTLLP